MARFCSNCGSEVDLDDNVCGNCGNVINNNASIPVNNFQSVNNAQSFNNSQPIQNNQIDGFAVAGYFITCFNFMLWWNIFFRIDFFYYWTCKL